MGTIEMVLEGDGYGGGIVLHAEDMSLIKIAPGRIACTMPRVTRGRWCVASAHQCPLNQSSAECTSEHQSQSRP
jgi:hypothetical protein